MNNHAEKKDYNRLLIIGAGGHGNVVADCAALLGQYHEIAFLDDRYNEDDKTSKKSGHWQILDKVDRWERYKSATDFIVAFGDNQLRLSTHKQLVAGGANITKIMHPNSTISNNARIGVGSVVLAGTVVNWNAIIGEACIINTLSCVEHDCIIENGVHIAPNACLAGGVRVNELSWLGIGSVVIQNTEIAANTQVGAGGVVIKNLIEPGVYVGNPVRKIK